MARVWIDGEWEEYGDNTRWKEVAEAHQDRYPYDILLVKVNGKLQELHKQVTDGGKVDFVTAKEEPGIQTYFRSCVLLMLRSFYDVVGKSRIDRVETEFSIGNGYFVKPAGDFKLDAELLDKVKKRMEELVESRVPICKRSVNTDEAIELFHRHKMYDKERLFRYRRVSRVNLYSIGGFEDYYYGYMVENTGYLKYFDLILYEHGFVLMIPRKSDPCSLPSFEPQKKLFSVLKESFGWGERLNLNNVGALNEQIASGRVNQLVLIQEALQEKKIGEIASQIAAQPSKKLVMIAGPSSSGKTTFSHRLSIQLEAMGLKPHPIEVDDYFVNREDSPRDENGDYDYEVLECLDVRQFNVDMNGLLNGETVELPYYNFKTGRREYRGDRLRLGKDEILVIEGIHCLNDRLSYTLPKENKFKIYISALTQLNIDEHNRIPSTDGRLIRRMVRDARIRGASALETIRRWPSVRRGEDRNIFPFQEEADVMFNSALIYELAMLKQYAEPLLFGIPRDCEEYLEAKRLLKFLDYFLGVNPETIPKNSILREFIGGGCF
ncbi:MAG: nucleoside kinase [Lachnospiraceae bacterium]|nr:nucleoside kinase [Lachnospiraceae bacterium]MCI9589436.1 nucleoside kinase [Lachnospiraceae bacterium]